MGFGGHSHITKGMGMLVRRITLVVDEKWGDAINEMTSYMESGEVCHWEEVSEPFEAPKEMIWGEEE
jgi:hypothetical protein